MTAYKAWLAARKDAYEEIPDAMQGSETEVQIALNIVRDAIRDQGLIIYGGQAIDYAIRQKTRGKEFLYDAIVRPDYDFYASDNYKVATSLGLALFEAGLRNVSVIPAIHVQTMKVRVDFESVADVSFVHPRLFARIPTFTGEGGLRCVDPLWQMIDMHLSLTRPYINAPREEVFHRFAKNIKRMGLILEYFPPSAYPDQNNLPSLTDPEDLRTEVILTPAMLQGYKLPPCARFTGVAGAVLILNESLPCPRIDIATSDPATAGRFLQDRGYTRRHCCYPLGSIPHFELWCGPSQVPVRLINHEHQIVVVGEHHSMMVLLSDYFLNSGRMSTYIKMLERLRKAPTAEILREDETIGVTSMPETLKITRMKIAELGGPVAEDTSDVVLPPRVYPSRGVAKEFDPLVNPLFINDGSVCDELEEKFPRE